MYIFCFDFHIKKIRGISNTSVRKVSHDLYIQGKGDNFWEKKILKDIVLVILIK